MRTSRFVLIASLVVLGGAFVPAADAQEVVTHTADVSGEWVFFDFDSPAVEVAVTDPRSSTDWDLGVLGTEISANGGASGPGSVLTYCICRNQYLSDDDLHALTPESGLQNFEAVTAADIPVDEADWDPGAIGANSWYRYDLTQHLIWPTYDVYLLKTGNEVYKVQFTSFYGPDGEPRHLTLRYARLTG